MLIWVQGIGRRNGQGRNGTFSFGVGEWTIVGSGAVASSRGCLLEDEDSAQQRGCSSEGPVHHTHRVKVTVKAGMQEIGNSAGTF